MYSMAIICFLLMLGTFLDGTSSKYTSEETNESSKSSYNAINTITSTAETNRQQHKHTYDNPPSNPEATSGVGVSAGIANSQKNSEVERSDAEQSSNTRTSYSSGIEISAIDQAPCLSSSCPLPSTTKSNTAHRENLEDFDFPRPQSQPVRPEVNKANPEGNQAAPAGLGGYATKPLYHPPTPSPETGFAGTYGSIASHTGYGTTLPSSYAAPQDYGTQASYPPPASVQPVYGPGLPIVSYGPIPPHPLPQHFGYSAPPYGYGSFPNYPPPPQFSYPPPPLSSYPVSPHSNYPRPPLPQFSYPQTPNYTPPYAGYPASHNPPQRESGGHADRSNDRSPQHTYPYTSHDTSERDRSSHHGTRDGDDHHNHEHHDHGYNNECGRKCKSGFEGNRGYSTVDHSLKTTSEYKETGHQEGYEGYGNNGGNGGYGSYGSQRGYSGQGGYSNSRNDGGSSYNGMFNRPAY